MKRNTMDQWQSKCMKQWDHHRKAMEAGNVTKARLHRFLACHAEYRAARCYLSLCNRYGCPGLAMSAINRTRKNMREAFIQHRAPVLTERCA